MQNAEGQVYNVAANQDRVDSKNEFARPRVVVLERICFSIPKSGMEADVVAQV